MARSRPSPLQLVMNLSRMSSPVKVVTSWMRVPPFPSGPPGSTPHPRIKELADRPYRVCSGGQRARVLIARALMAEPALLLLDEPFNALDLPSREDLVEAMHHMAERRPGLATVMITHHLEELSPAVDHVLLLREGRVLAGGPADEVLTGPWLSGCFGCPVRVARHDGRWAAYSGRSRAA
ncbi:ATP-binding cassette domain-containing protein [Streptomyces sp. NPDC057428]|uniref:ATP-binding cassette domain-containing protein n=1 Tax=Streptomyces sp. NPDC057428 TaxID=3346129 RepID=UPI0036875DCF